MALELEQQAPCVMLCVPLCIRGRSLAPGGLSLQSRVGVVCTALSNERRLLCAAGLPQGELCRAIWRNRSFAMDRLGVVGLGCGAPCLRAEGGPALLGIGQREKEECQSRLVASMLHSRLSVSGVAASVAGHNMQDAAIERQSRGKQNPKN